MEKKSFLRHFWSSAWLVMACLLLADCGSREMKVPVSATFRSIQSNTIAPKCVSCHQSLATYDGLLKIVKPGNPADSDLYEVVAEGEMPLQSPKLSSTEITAIYDWIRGGARND